MGNLRIITDSACDISKDLLKEWGVYCIDMSYSFEGDKSDADISIKDFYNRMREGEVAKTSAINPAAFLDCFKPVLAGGEDILYLSFSSGLSTTCNSANIAAGELAGEFPERKIAVVDSLCASAGEGLFVYLVAQKRAECGSLEELARYAEDIKLNICHWFTVDDLVYLKRGGRVSSTAAFVGGLLGIKPVLHVDNSGHLINVSKARGRKSSIKALADKYGELATDKKDGTVFISNGDCIDDANMLADILNERYGAKVRIITDIGSVIGAHSGPGTLALFFLGKER